MKSTLSRLATPDTRTSTSAHSRLTESLGWWLFIAVLALFLTALHLTMTKPFDLTTLQQLVHFWAVEPFQHRVLLPATVAGIERILPVQTRLMFALLEVGFWMALIQLAYLALGQFDIGRGPLDRRLLGLTVVIPMAVHLFVPDLKIQHGLALDDGALGLGDWDEQPIFYYVYDLPAAVFTLGLMLILLRLEHTPRSPRLLLVYIGLFAVATVNRETTLFMLPASAWMLWRRRHHTTGAILGLIVTQAVVFIAIQWPLQRIFSVNDNPAANVQYGGLQYEHHLIENLLVLSHPLYFVTYAVRFSAGCGLAVLVFRHHLDPRLKHLIAGFALPLGLTALVMGRLVEQRIFIEMIPLLWLAALQALHTRRELRAAAGSEPVSAERQDDSPDASARFAPASGAWPQTSLRSAGIRPQDVTAFNHP